MIVTKNNYSIDVFLQSPEIKIDLNKIPKKIHKKQRMKHLEAAITHAKKELTEVLEFGVRTGGTLKLISDNFSDCRVYGFDSFEGLPEGWSKGNHESYDKSAFKCDPPETRPNAELVIGWFDQSIPKWIEHHKTQKIKFIHIDCDLYSSTKTILKLLNDHIVSGTIIVFDEMYSWNDPNQYATWETGEYQALKEWVEEFDRSFIPVCRSGYEQCTIQIC